MGRGGRLGILVVSMVLTGGCGTAAVVAPRRTARSQHVVEVAEGPLRIALLHLERVHFALDSATLSSTGRASLRRAADVLREHPEVTLRIEGYADPRGASEYNLGLGLQRAHAVMQYLRELGVSEQRLFPISYGEEQAIRGMDEGSLARSRRVDFRLLRGPVELVVDRGELLDDRGQPL